MQAREKGRMNLAIFDFPLTSADSDGLFLIVMLVTLSAACAIIMFSLWYRRPKRYRHHHTID